MGAVFVSYRREDSAGQARALSIELAQIIGKESVFMDVDNIALGRDFREAIHERLESCDVLLALIGPDWLDARDTSGGRRLDSPSDFVRLEIAAALARNIPVTPVLVRGAQMPAEASLPVELKNLAYRNGFPLRHETWESDVTELARRLGLSRSTTASAAVLSPRKDKVAGVHAAADTPAREATASSSVVGKYALGAALVAGLVAVSLTAPLFAGAILGVAGMVALVRSLVARKH
jgi:hypothetical protein